MEKGAKDITTRTALDPILKELRKPFTVDAVKFKPNKKVPENQDFATVQCFAFIDARLVSDRLNNVVGGEWHDEYVVLTTKTPAIECALTVKGVTRRDVGEAGPFAPTATPKAVYSDALKRAAVKFGIGNYLYALPLMRAEINKYGLTPAGRTSLREQYLNWLDDPRVREYWGEPTDHGDSPDAHGDVEVDAPTEVVEETPKRPGSGAPQTAEVPEPKVVIKEVPAVIPEEPLQAPQPGPQESESATVYNEIFEVLKDKERISPEARKAIFVFLKMPANTNKEYIINMPIDKQKELLTALQNTQHRIKQNAKTGVAAS